jgi:hypothetical protein
VSRATRKQSNMPDLSRTRKLENLKSMWTSTAFIRTWAVSLMTEVVRLQVSVGDETALIYLWQIVPSDA